jgi:hypothetical protein
MGNLMLRCSRMPQVDGALVIISFEKPVVNSVPMIARARRDLSNYNDVYKNRCWYFNAGRKV